MIATLTPNPSVDRTVFVDALPHGQVIRSTNSWIAPSGKGAGLRWAAAAVQHRGTLSSGVDEDLPVHITRDVPLDLRLE
jgi:1-phosphofructokinase